MKKLLLILTIALTGCLTSPEPCNQGMVDVYTHHRYVSQYNYEVLDFSTQEECDASIKKTPAGEMGDGSRGPSYCNKSRELGCTNMSVGGK